MIKRSQSEEKPKVEPQDPVKPEHKEHKFVKEHNFDKQHKERKEHKEQKERKEHKEHKVQDSEGTKQRKDKKEHKDKVRESDTTATPSHDDIEASLNFQDRFKHIVVRAAKPFLKEGQAAEAAASHSAGRSASEPQKQAGQLLRVGSRQSGKPSELKEQRTASRGSESQNLKLEEMRTGSAKHRSSTMDQVWMFVIYLSFTSWAWLRPSQLKLWHRPPQIRKIRNSSMIDNL